MKDIQILVIGGGIGGLACAIALKKAGFSPVVFEKRKDIDQIGGALVLRPLSTKVLNHLGVLLSLLPHSEILKSTSVRNSKGTLLKKWTLPQMETPTIFCRRSDLLRCLHEQTQKMNIPVHLDAVFSRFERTSDQVTAHFENALTVNGAALIGTDGIWSQVRTQLMGSEEPRFRGYVQWRYLTQESPAFVLPEEKVEWWGESARFGVTRIGKTGMQWYVSLTSADPHWKGDGNIHEFFKKIFDGWDEPVQTLIRNMDAEPLLIRNPIYDRPYTETWGEGPITLLGDAAHPITPDLGLGAGLAIIDAAQLAQSLSNSSNIQDGLRDYEQCRKKVARRISKESGWLGQMAQSSRPWIVKLRDQMISRCPDTLWNRQISRTYFRDSL